MPKITIFYGFLLVMLGAAGYILSNAESVTALIPAVFGLFFVLFGIVALSEKWRKHAMHGAVLFALFAVLGTVSALGSLPALLLGDNLERPLAVASQSITALLSLLFIILCIQSFIKARKNS